MELVPRIRGQGAMLPRRLQHLWLPWPLPHRREVHRADLANTVGSTFLMPWLGMSAIQLDQPIAE